MKAEELNIEYGELVKAVLQACFSKDFEVSNEKLKSLGIKEDQLSSNIPREVNTNPNINLHRATNN
ncbi:MAG: hypothetical protein Q9M91_02925 [Candidatus Dojkabacteria bacterium]|nr:hypothetical protein [Candidatus Dojkabacteria bacterium]